jgi:hypothetical protein
MKMVDYFYYGMVGLKPVCRVRCEVFGAMATKSAVIYPEDGDRIGANVLVEPAISG